MDVRVTRPLPMPNTVGTTAHQEGDHAQDHGVLITGTEESADKRDNETSTTVYMQVWGEITNKINITHCRFSYIF